MGGGEGSAAREALRHKSIEEVVMCDIDQVTWLISFSEYCHFIWMTPSDNSMLLIAGSGQFLPQIPDCEPRCILQQKA